MYTHTESLSSFSLSSCCLSLLMKHHFARSKRSEAVEAEDSVEALNEFSVLTLVPVAAVATVLMEGT